MGAELHAEIVRVTGLVLEALLVPANSGRALFAEGPEEGCEKVRELLCGTGQFMEVDLAILRASSSQKHRLQPEWDAALERVSAFVKEREDADKARRLLRGLRE